MFLYKDNGWLESYSNTNYVNGKMMGLNVAESVSISIHIGDCIYGNYVNFSEEYVESGYYFNNFRISD